MKVVCGPRVLVVVHRRRKDHGEDLQLSQPVLGWKMGEGGDNKAANSEAEEVDIRRGTQMCEAH